MASKNSKHYKDSHSTSSIVYSKPTVAHIKITNNAQAEKDRSKFLAIGIKRSDQTSLRVYIHPRE